MDDLVSTGWLAGALGQPDLAIVDSTMFMPADRRDAAAEFRQAHIPGARFLDIGAVADHEHRAPHMLPGASEFGAFMTALGVGSGDRIVVYDNSPLRSAARGWFMLRHFGAAQVAILDGGFQKWRGEGRPVEQGEAKARPARFDPTAGADVVSLRQLRTGTGRTIVDARSRARFEGQEPDPRPGVAAGHIPGARNLPFGELYKPDATLKDPDALRAAFAAAGVDPLVPFVASCGSGVTANSLIFAARLLGGRDLHLYDGSWSEWGADPSTSKAVGPPEALDPEGPPKD